MIRYRILDDYETEDEFTEVYWIKYASIEQAQEAKRKLDNYPFLSKQLDVSYAPQYETLSDTREKILDRKKQILSRLNNKPAIQTVPSKVVPALSHRDINYQVMPFAPPSYADSKAPDKEKSTTETTPTPNEPVNKTILDIRNKLSKTYNNDSQPKRRRI